MRRTMLAVVLLLVLAACGQESLEGDAFPDGPTIGGSILVSPEPDLANPTSAGIRRIGVRERGETLLVHYAGGDHRCYGLDHFDVEYRERVVVVAVYEGERSGVDLCTDIGIYKVAEVPLEESLGDRRAVDALTLGAN